MKSTVLKIKLIMTIVFSLISTNLVPASVAHALSLELKVFKNNKYEVVKIQEYGGFRLSELCFKTKVPKCQALAETTHKVELSKSPIPLEGNPAARFCLDHGGLNRILLSSDRKQYDYCLFKDGSMVDAWDMYSHFFPKKVID